MLVPRFGCIVTMPLSLSRSLSLSLLIPSGVRVAGWVFFCSLSLFLQLAESSEQALLVSQLDVTNRLETGRQCYTASYQRVCVRLLHASIDPLFIDIVYYVKVC